MRDFVQRRQWQLGLPMQVKYSSIQTFFASLHPQFFWADLLEYKQTSYMAAALFIVSQMQVTMITCCRHFNSRAAQGQQLVHHLSSSISFRSFRHNSGQQECVLSSDDSNSLPEGLVTSPVHSFYQMVNIFSPKQRNPDTKTNRCA